MPPLPSQSSIITLAISFTLLTPHPRPHRPYPHTAMLSTVLRRTCTAGSSGRPVGGAAALHMCRSPQASSLALAAGVAGRSCRAAFNTQSSSSSSSLSLNNLSDNPGAKTEVGGVWYVCVWRAAKRLPVSVVATISIRRTLTLLPIFHSYHIPPSVLSVKLAHTCRSGLRFRKGQNGWAGNEWTKEAIKREHSSRLRRRANPLTPPPTQDRI